MAAGEGFESPAKTVKQGGGMLIALGTAARGADSEIGA